MAYLFFEILGSLVVVAIAAFALGWYLRGLREKARSRFDSDLAPGSDSGRELDLERGPDSGPGPGSDRG